MRRSHAIGMLAGLLMGGATMAAQAAACTRESFGLLPDGREVEKFTLRSAAGHSAAVITYGATLQALLIPDREGRLADVVLGYPDMRGYLEHRNFIGATVGRYANRIAHARFALDGLSHHLPANDGPNSLHGGAQGFDRVLWTPLKACGGTASMTLTYDSPDGDQGYPGRLTATATYSLDATGQLTIDYRAKTDRPTIVNLSNHAYFNLAGEGSESGAMGHRVTIPAQAYLPVDRTLIPTGERRSVAGTPFDFREPRTVGERVRDYSDEQIRIGRGYDHDFVLAAARVPAPRVVVRMEDPASGRVLEILSAEPGLQFYSGNVLDGTEVGKAGKAYRQGDALVFEPQLHPDTPNQAAFGSARLDPGGEYRHVILYRPSVSPR